MRNIHHYTIVIERAVMAAVAGILCVLAVLSAAVSAASSDLLPEDTVYEMIVEYSDYYAHPNLPYEYNAMEPFVNAATLQVHHQGHHRGYCAKMNAALKEWREKEPDSVLARSSLYDIMRNLSSVPEQWRTAIRNNGGGFINHIFYFITMRNKVYTAPQNELEEQVNATFGDYENFMREFGQAANGLFGSGYVWLVEDEERNISIVTTVNQDCPISNGLYPLLVLDVWEHAYYLDHQNRRSKYVSNWWGVTHWAAASRIQRWWREVRGDTEEEEEDEEYEWEIEERERKEREEREREGKEREEREREGKEREMEEREREDSERREKEGHEEL